MTGDGLQLDEVVLLGRTFDEYRAFFALTDADLQGARVLDMGSGVGSFAAEARGRGYDVLGADPIYGAPPEAVERKCRADLAEVARQLPGVSHKYLWGGFYRDVADLVRQRETAYRGFLADYGRGGDRFVRAALPHTGFAAGRFTLTLVSHFLFLYDDRLDAAFHEASVQELERITNGEIRIYPLVNLSAERSRHVDAVAEAAAGRGRRVELRPVDFEFFKGAREMLVIDTRAR